MPKVSHISRGGISPNCLLKASELQADNPSPPLNIFMATSAYWRVKSWNYTASLSVTGPPEYSPNTFSISDSDTVLQGTLRRYTTFIASPSLLIREVNAPSDETQLVCGPTSWGFDGYVLKLGRGGYFQPTASGGEIQLAVETNAGLSFIYKEDSEGDPFKANYYPFFNFRADVVDFGAFFSVIVGKAGSFPAGAFSITTSEGTASQNLYWTATSLVVPTQLSCNVSLEAASYWDYKD